MTFKGDEMGWHARIERSEKPVQYQRLKVSHPFKDRIIRNESSRLCSHVGGSLQGIWSSLVMDGPKPRREIGDLRVRSDPFQVPISREQME